MEFWIITIISNFMLVKCDNWEPEINVTKMGSNHIATFFLNSNNAIIIDHQNDLLISRDHGKSWNNADFSFDCNGRCKFTYIETYGMNDDTAIISTNSKRIFYTFDSGESFGYFDLPIPITKKDYLNSVLNFNFINKNYVLIEFSIYYTSKNKEEIYTYYTKDNFKTLNLLAENVRNCLFTKSNSEFVQGNDNDIICIQSDHNVFDVKTSDKIVFSSDFFKTSKIIEIKDPVDVHIQKLSIIGPFIIADVSKDRYSYDSVNIYTSKDGINFAKAYFDGSDTASRVKILLSENNMLYANVELKNNVFLFTSSVYKSDSDGKYFKLIFNDKSPFYQGSTKLNIFDGGWILYNEIDSNENKDQKDHEDDNNSDDDGPFFRFEEPNLKTIITFDDGKTQSYLNITDYDNGICNNDFNCSFNILEIGGRIFGNFPRLKNDQGIIIALGSVGKYSNRRSEVNTYISKDNGFTWRKIKDGAYESAFLDNGNIIILFPSDRFQRSFQDDDSNSFQYSLDQGETFSKYKFDFSFQNGLIVSNPISKNLVLQSWVRNDKMSLISIDFSNAYTKQCTKADFEEWIPLKDSITNKPICNFGHSLKLERRKPKSQCFLSEPINIVKEKCACTENDFECNYGFMEDDEGNCQPIFDIMSQYCDSNQKMIKLSSRRKLPGNLCENGYEAPENDFTLRCKLANEEKEKQSIKIKITEFDDKIEYFQYLDKNSSLTAYQEETLVAITKSKEAFISFNGGENFAYISGDSFNQVITNPYWPDSIYMITDNGTIYSSLNRGKSFYQEEIPNFQLENSEYYMTFTSYNPSNYILFCNTNCDSTGNCDRTSYTTVDNGKTFTKLIDDGVNCIYADTVFPVEHFRHDDRIFCLTKPKNQSYGQLIAISERRGKKKLYDGILNMKILNKYLIITKLNEDNSIGAMVSLNGVHFAEVKLPYNVEIMEQTNLKLLELNSMEIFLYVQTSNVKDHEFGALLKGNFNGTLFSTVLNNVNANEEGIIDFEKIDTLEGLLIANIVKNSEDVINGQEKQIITKFSYNNGATWFEFPKPYKDLNGDVIKCDTCSLHLHSVTDRTDPLHDTFSSKSALGMLFGLGNVGNHLLPLSDSENLSLYFSKDAGLTWRELFKGNYIWEFGDQGTLLFVVETSIETNIIKYSTDFGDTWVDYNFSPDKKYIVEDILTSSSDSLLKINLLVISPENFHDIISFDFNNIYPRQCASPFSSEKSISDDFEYFIPYNSELGNSCLFGHTVKYVRRKPNKDCFIGNAPLYLRNTIVNNCKCTREDYECDYNYELANDGTCQLVKGLKSLTGKEVCSDPFVSEWWTPTGYRKLDMSTCENGLILDKISVKSCPNWSWNKRRLNGKALFWTIFIPVTTFILSLVIIYDRGIRRKGGFRRLGEIRLDRDDNLIIGEERSYDFIIDKIVSFGVISYYLMNKGLRFILNIFNRISHRYNTSDNDGYDEFSNDVTDDNNNYQDNNSIFDSSDGQYIDDAEELNIN